jgi:hypothetical protein
MPNEEAQEPRAYLGRVAPKVDRDRAFQQSTLRSIRSSVLLHDLVFPGLLTLLCGAAICCTSHKFSHGIFYLERRDPTHVFYFATALWKDR